MKAIMVDMETLGVRDTSEILSLGAVVFDPFTRQTKEELLEASFYACPTYTDEDSKHFTYDQSTIDWWGEQSDNAMRVIDAGPHVPVRELLNLFSEFWKSHDAVQIWAKPPSFDVDKLEHHFRVFNMYVPWNFRNVFDVRTVLMQGEYLANFKPNYPEGGIPHYALDDAIAQALMVQEVHEVLRGLRNA